MENCFNLVNDAFSIEDVALDDRVIMKREIIENRP
jgi:hypothetical protein